MRRNEKIDQRQVIPDKKAIVAEEKPSAFARRFWLSAAGVVLLSLITHVFDFSLVPPRYNGVQLAQSFCGLHSWDLADRAWAARRVIVGLSRNPTMSGTRYLMIIATEASQRNHSSAMRSV